MTLQETMDTFHRLMRGSLSPEDAAAQLGVPENRARAYRGFVRNHIRNVLEKNFTIVRRLFSNDIWEKLTDRFYDRYPAEDYELNANAAAFCDMLEQLASNNILGVTLFHAELALVEWQEFVVFSNEIDIPKPLDLERPAVNPTLVTLECTFPVGTYLRNARSCLSANKALPAVPGNRDDETVFLFRHPKNDLAYVYRATEDLLFAFKMAYESVRLEDAVALSGLLPDEVRKIWSRAVSIGLVIEPNQT